RWSYYQLPPNLLGRTLPYALLSHRPNLQMDSNAAAIPKGDRRQHEPMWEDTFLRRKGEETWGLARLTAMAQNSSTRRKTMKIQRLHIALTIVNLGLLIFLLAQIRRVDAEGVAPVLRGRALEIVDDQSRVRASILVQPADPKARTASGKPYPETVILRLVDAKGRPEVKLGASEQGSGLGLIGETDSTYVVLKAEGSDSSLKMINQEGRQQIIKP